MRWRFSSLGISPNCHDLHLKGVYGPLKTGFTTPYAVAAIFSVLFLSELCPNFHLHVCPETRMDGSISKIPDIWAFVLLSYNWILDASWFSWDATGGYLDEVLLDEYVLLWLCSPPAGSWLGFGTDWETYPPSWWPTVSQTYPGYVYSRLNPLEVKPAATISSGAFYLLSFKDFIFKLSLRPTQRGAGTYKPEDQEWLLYPVSQPGPACLCRPPTQFVYCQGPLKPSFSLFCLESQGRLVQRALEVEGAGLDGITLTHQGFGSSGPTLM